MASKLCCTAEDESRTSSPEIPNARVTTATHAKLPLIPNCTPSQNSHFTSARTEDLHELRQVFHNASEDDANAASPAKPARARLIRPSVYSLHTLHKMKSMRSMIRHKFSKDLSKRPSGGNVKPGAAKKNAAATEPDTVLKQNKDGPNLQLKITKEDLRKDLLSDKKPDDGGYDPDARVLDDIAKNIGKRMPKRRSIHSIDWSPSTASKPTPGSSSKSHHSYRPEPYQIKHQSNTLSNRFSQVFSTPNLRAGTSAGQERRLKRSYSASSMHLPVPSPLSPLRLPSLKSGDEGGLPWSVALTESLGFSQFSAAPRKTLPDPKNVAGCKLDQEMGQNQGIPQNEESEQATTKDVSTSATIVAIRVQEPTATTTSRPSTSDQGTDRGTDRENAPPASPVGKGESQEDDQDDSRQSIHLYSMRISHHLRSGSLLSWDNRPSGAEQSLSDLDDLSRMQSRQTARHERQTSSSGFASSKVPSKWGRVVPDGVHQEDKSSIYSSRPQSVPDSSSGSVINFNKDVNNLTLNSIKPRRSNSYSTDNEETPRPPTRHGLLGPKDAATDPVINTSSPDQISNLARNHSVESIKLSRFREELSPSPPKKRLMASASIMKFLKPKRSGLRSHSEGTNPPLEISVDGALEVPRAATLRERRMSRSIEAEQEALGKDKNAVPLWEQALKSYQDERAAMFLPKNKDLALHSSPLRERTGSLCRSRVSMESRVSVDKHHAMKRYSAPLLGVDSFNDFPPEGPPKLRSRRTAVISQDVGDRSFLDEMQRHFDQHTDVPEAVGAWGRYPSHSRPDRNASAGHLDSVRTRDFALEAAINFATGNTGTIFDEDLVDPMERPASPPLLPGQKRRKKKAGHNRMSKSNSMTFGKNFFKNYAKIFKSQNMEYQKHGHGHRSSITGGGVLEFPELELLPDIFRGDVTQTCSRQHSRADTDRDTNEEEYGPGDRKGKGKLVEEDSESTLRPGNKSKPLGDTLMSPALDGQVESPYKGDNARALSAYYENCLPAYPRASTEVPFNAEEFGVVLSQFSFDTKRNSTHSHTMPSRLNSVKHLRNTSHMSRYNALSQGSGGTNFLSRNEDAEAGASDEQSLVSVRRSTTDLMTLFKEQEDEERNKVLGLMRAESQKGVRGL